MLDFITKIYHNSAQKENPNLGNKSAEVKPQIGNGELLAQLQVKSRENITSKDPEYAVIVDLLLAILLKFLLVLTANLCL